MESIDRENIHLIENNREGEEGEDYSHLIGEFGLSEELAKASWVCVGGGAKNFVHLLLDTLDPKDHEFTRILGANTDPQQFIRLLRNKSELPRFFSGWAPRAKSGEFRLLQLGNKGGAGRVPEVAAEEVRKKADEIAKCFNNSRVTILVANLGGGTGSGAAPEIAKMLGEKKEEIGSLAVQMIPWAHEGIETLNRAQKAYAEVRKHIATLTLRNQALYEVVNDPRYEGLAEELRGADTDDAIRIMNKRALEPIIYALDQLIMHAASCINRDPADFKKIVQSGKDVYISSYIGEAPKDSEGIDRIVDHLLNNPFLDRKIVERAKLGMILYKGFLHSDTGSISDRIIERMKGDDPGKSVELMPGHDKGEPGTGAIFFAAVAEEEDAIDWVNFDTQIEDKGVQPKKQPGKTPVAPLPPPPPNGDAKVKVRLGLKGQQSDIEEAMFQIPADLAERIENFSATHKKTTLRERDQAWKDLCREVQPYLRGKQMAALQPMKFLNPDCAKKAWHITPLLRKKYQQLEQRIMNRANGNINKEEAMALFEALSQDWEAETGERLHIKTSKIFEEAFSPKNEAKSFFSKLGGNKERT